MQTDKPVYAPGETVKVTVIALGLTDSAWIWLVPDTFEVGPTARPDKSAYPHHTVGTSSTLQLTAGDKGHYRIYLFSSKQRSAPLVSRSFEVEGQPVAPTPERGMERRPISPSTP